jgi:hypothetical protein
MYRIAWFSGEKRMKNVIGLCTSCLPGLDTNSTNFRGPDNTVFVLIPEIRVSIGVAHRLEFRHNPCRRALPGVWLDPRWSTRAGVIELN